VGTNFLTAHTTSQAVSQDFPAFSLQARGEQQVLIATAFLCAAHESVTIEPDDCLETIK
jgi:hypothetical protein